ncbi:hypothetical protein KCTC32516_00269 [Polaribacter huanghezhanensis]|uniref:hypothetical protein n=1 Tax=Polaribacter huanghezhanensis TaxID=1354726 RepID=UPI002647B6FE|nr:hypothetical protein [Polaribacter huanghezhanensis]WKD84932.1 hypothetical protein KCTC32516_00269 [Polaribacter huanghezhanensis]
MSNSKRLHIVSFNIPYPPSYGGVIDVFYKIKELHQLNIEIYLHCFEYDRPQQKELEKYCTKVFYYNRASKIKSLFSSIPFIIKNRENNLLINTLKKIKAPILFEGLHTTFPLTKTIFDSKTFVRTHNIEHNYFKELAKSEANVFKKLFYQLEAIKLKKYESVLKNVTGVFSISPFEQEYFSSKYGEKCDYIPAFHEAKLIKNHSTKGSFILYHGDLRISDNIKAALFLIDVYKESSFKLVIASSDKSSVIKEIDTHQNIDFKSINNQNELKILFKKAHINTLITFQKTGIKLKLLNSLYQGKFIIGNSKMIADTGLEDLCELANTKEEILQKTGLLFSKEFSESEIEKRKEKLKSFSPNNSAKKMMEIIFK